VLLAHGVLVAGLIVDRIFFHAARLPDFKQTRYESVTKGMQGVGSERRLRTASVQAIREG